MITPITTIYAWENLPRLTVQVALGFAVLGVGLIALAWRNHRAERRKKAHRWLPILVGIAAAAITVSLWQAIVIDQRAQSKERVGARTALVRNEITVEIQSHILALDRMARRWHLNGMKDQQERKSDAAMIVGDYKGIEGIRWIDAANHIGWTIPLQGHEAEQGVYLALEERRSAALDAARSTRQIAVSRLVELTTGGQGFLVLVPLYDGDNFAGYMAGFFRIQHLLDTVLSAEVTSGYAVVVYEGNDEIYRRSESTNQEGSEWAHTKQLALSGMDWRVKVWPEKAMMTELQSSIPTATLVFGLLISSILAWTVWLAQSAHQRSKIMEATSLSLEREVAERTLAEQALAGALEKERALFENTLDVVCSVNAEGRFVSINPACLRLWGYRQEELVGRRYIDMVVPEDIPKTNEAAARIIKGEATLDFVNRLNRMLA